MKKETKRKANQVIRCLCILYLFIQSTLSADIQNIQSFPFYKLMNPNPTQSLLNSVDFHPDKNLFCVTFSQNNALGLYQLNDDQEIVIFQTLKNPRAQLSSPQHAVFSRDGNSLVCCQLA